MKIQESGENYLETILMLEQKNGTVRSIDIANELEFSKPSVSRAMSILRTAGYITMDKNNLILLTEEGRRRAEAIYDRHCTLTRFLEALGISAENAAADACRIEHIISELPRGMTLKAGTIISTGTPSGVGIGFTPPVFLKSGDEVECIVEGIGSIKNRVK